MTVRAHQPPTSPRRLACARCGAEFSCSLTGDCWCGEEAVKLPLPASGSTGFDDCLCRACLRILAAETQASSSQPKLHDEDRRREDD